MGWLSRARLNMASRRPLDSGHHEPAGAFDFGRQYIERRHVAVPLDQGRRMTARERPAIKVPNDIANRTAMVVDQQTCAAAVAVFGEASKVKFADVLHWKRIDIGPCVEAVVDRGNVDVVDVEQQSAAGALRHGAQEL